MLIESAVYELLRTSSSVVAIASTRIFFGELPDRPADYPVIVYRPKGDKRPIDTLEGGVALMSQTFQVFSCGRRTSASKKLLGQLDEAIFQTLFEFAGTVEDQSSPPETIQVQGVFCDDGHRYDMNDLRREADPDLCSFMSEFRFHYLDPVRQDP